jgi:hypothetical protein
VSNRFARLFAIPIGLTFKMIQVSPVFIVMAIYAQIFPVAAVSRVVVVIVVPVMNREQMEVSVGELHAAAGAYPWMDPQ